ncbi:hypothetical protein DSO57_1008978 [Entomophthora muscae]|uniref:Uncharacterized protein n=1 Tax=Entomophthora muscae TaxID=34485 RepID=A0ACC2SW49_9FUNG|nr:hypothetical protein DSO57_1008978 [Entomophthora muscae]
MPKRSMHQTMKESSSFSGSLLTLVPINETRRYLEAHFSIHPKLDALVEKVLARRWKNSLFVEWEKIGWIADIRWESQDMFKDVYWNYKHGPREFNCNDLSIVSLL